VGKTTLARTLARAVAAPSGGSSSRATFCRRISGRRRLRQTAQEFRFHRGDLRQRRAGDEINRATPKTQSAMLEAMSDRQVTTEARHGRCPSVPGRGDAEPLEIVGTYPLPESQLDRFLMRVVMARATGAGGGAAADGGALARGRLAAGHGGLHRCRPGRPAADGGLGAHRGSLLSYVHALVQRTRQGSTFSVGASPRGAMSLVLAARARALPRLGLLRAGRRATLLPARAGPRLHPPGGCREDGRAYAEDALRRILASVRSHLAMASRLLAACAPVDAGFRFTREAAGSRRHAGHRLRAINTQNNLLYCCFACSVADHRLRLPLRVDAAPAGHHPHAAPDRLAARRTRSRSASATRRLSVVRGGGGGPGRGHVTMRGASTSSLRRREQATTYPFVFPKRGATASRLRGADEVSPSGCSSSRASSRRRPSCSSSRAAGGRARHEAEKGRRTPHASSGGARGELLDRGASCRGTIPG